MPIRRGSRARLIQNWHAPSPTRDTIKPSVTWVTEDVRPGDPRRALGQLGEQLAADHLRHRGFEIVERNYRTRWGELDVVAFDGRTLAFCEVKTRRVGPRGGHPFDGLRSGKRTKVRKMAGQWLIERTSRPYADVLRLDAIAVIFDLSGELVAIEHLEGAW